MRRPEKDLGVRRKSKLLSMANMGLFDCGLPATSGPPGRRSSGHIRQERLGANDHETTRRSLLGTAFQV
ncbi:hypothetical protein FVE85_6123 [Porphyridium purpureum]|uniref:Uncharacterized protein n=1 Tax=Porphyridium purpureum TaxID=35688 RepID=A0A5J4Z5P5_PORPP|nr:hypothetical protein FVE85_6123 [Porphyridium purpureum]|eukprot:POR4450..scf295_1